MDSLPLMNAYIELVKKALNKDIVINTINESQEDLNDSILLNPLDVVVSNLIRSCEDNYATWAANIVEKRYECIS
jgi:hypothetical protein